MGTAWKIVLLVVMVGALAAAIPSPDDGVQGPANTESVNELPVKPVKDLPGKAVEETPPPPSVYSKRSENDKDKDVVDTRSESDRGSGGSLFDDIFNIPIRVLEAVRDLVNNRGKYFTANKGVQQPERKDQPAS